MSIKEWMKNSIIIAVAYCVTILIGLISGYGITGIELVLPTVFGVLCGIAFYIKKKTMKCTVHNVDTVKKMVFKNLRYSLPFALFFSATVVVGEHIDAYENRFVNFTIKDVLIWFLLSLSFTFVLGFLFNKADQVKLGGKAKNGISKIKERKCYFIVIGILLLCWLPYYLTFFPGNIGSDTIESVNMCLGNIPWTNHHPVFFTFLLNVVIKATAFIGNLNTSLAIFSCLHAVVFAATLSYILLWLYRKMASMKFLAICVVCFAFHPIVAMYSIYLTKDVLFSCLTVLFVLKLYDFVQTRGELFQQKKEVIKLFLLSLGVIALRNNGMVMVIGTLICLLLVYRKQWKPIVIVLGSVILITALYKGPIFKAIGIQSQSFAESASIPLQQVGYVIWTDGKISDEDKDFLNQIMPLERVKEVYDPGYTDSYKFDKEFNDIFINENKAEFLKVWGRLLPGNFDSYLKAYLMQTLGYWHYGETNTVCTQGVTQNNLSISQVDVIKQVLGVSLESIMEKLVLAARKAPLFCILSSMAMQIFAVFLCVINDCRTKRIENILAMVPCILLWGTIMIATPAFCLFRYLFPVFILWPVLIVEFFSCSSNET